MPGLSSEELTRRYGHLLKDGEVITVAYGANYPCTCKNCRTRQKAVWWIRVIKPAEEFFTNTLAVCRDYAACERRRKEQAGG